MCSVIIQCGDLMFTSQARNTSLRLSVPPAGKDWSSVVIPDAHIPQDQRSTSRAATSSALSEGLISRTQWWNNDEQRDVVLDAVSVETPEVKPNSEETNWQKSDPLGLWHIPSWWPDIRADGCLLKKFYFYAFRKVMIQRRLPIVQHHRGLSGAGLSGASLNP
jgi:hypothetical protein